MQEDWNLFRGLERVFNMEKLRDAKAEIKIINNEDGYYYFFGYYDLQPFDSNDKYHLCHRVKFMDRLPLKDDVCELGVLDPDTKEFIKYSETTAWNFQQGAMLQWFVPDESIVYNVREGDGFNTEIKNIKTGETRRLPLAVANISNDRKYGLCLNMSRIFDFRPGYGYSEVPDPYFDIKAPEDDGVFLMDMETGEYKLIINYADIIKQFPREPYTDCKLVVNHITFNTSGTRFLFLLRNFREGNAMWNTQLITSDLEGNLCPLSDYISNSHYNWKNDKQILIVTSHTGNTRDNLCLRDDFTGDTIMYDLPELHEDIHCLYSPNQRYIIGDGYPIKEDYRKLWLYDTKENKAILLVSVYSYKAALGDVRCDLHARWNHKGNKITFDSNHNGARCVCEMDLSDIVEY